MNEANQNFDIPALLKMGCLNVRSIAAIKPSMTLKEYFSLLSKFISLASSASGALTKIAGLGGDGDTVKCLEDIAIVMTGIGCSDLITEIDDIISTYKKGDVKSAADFAKKIFNDFVELFTQVMAAKSINEGTVVNDAEYGIRLPDDLSKPNELITLTHYLKQLDNEEETRKLRILVVDDSTVILKVALSILGDDYHVFTLAKSTLVEKFLQQITPELFLLDYKMPELSGFDLVPIIRSFEEHKDTPIIFLTSQGTIDNLSAAILLGARDFVVKPIRPEILREKIAKNIVRKKAF